MTYEVRLTLAGRRDLEQLRSYLLETAGARQARETLVRIREAFATLASFPERGGHPRELADLGEVDYRQIIVSPYRVMYRIENQRVLVFVVADGRRDMQALLAKRLLAQT